MDNKLNKFILPIIYDHLTCISDNLIEAELNGLKGAFDYNGKLIIPLIYDKFKYIENGYLLAFIKNKGYIYNKNGGLIISNLDCIYNDSGDLYTDNTIVNHKQQTFIIIRINGKYGVINEKGKFILPMQYENIKFCNLSNPLFIAEGFDEYTVFFDLNGKIVKKDKFLRESIVIFEELNLIKVGLLNSGWGLYDSYGKVVVPCIYSNINFLQTNTSNDKEGYLLVEQDALVKKDSFKYEIKEKMGLLDNKGNVIFRPIYDNITLTNNKAIVNINNKKGLFDLNNNMILPISYDYLSEISNGLLIGRKENEFYLIELNEKFLKL